MLREFGFERQPGSVYDKDDRRRFAGFKESRGTSDGGE